MDVLHSSLMELEEKNVQINDIKKAITNQAVAQASSGSAAKKVDVSPKEIDHIIQMLTSLNALASYDNLVLANEIYKEIVDDLRNLKTKLS